MPPFVVAGHLRRLRRAILFRARTGHAASSTWVVRTLPALATTWLEVQPAATLRPLAKRLLHTHAPTRERGRAHVPKVIDRILRHLRAKAESRAGPWATRPPAGRAANQAA